MGTWRISGLAQCVTGGSKLAGSYMRTPEHRAKMSQILTGRIFTNEHKQHLSRPKSLDHREKIRQSKLGANNPLWKSERTIDSNGYVRVYMPDHPQAFGTHRVYVYEHRLVMERHLGRYLLSNEIPHHINGIRSDNRIENLELVSVDKHNSYHHTGWRPSEATRRRMSEASKRNWEKRKQGDS